MTCTACEYNFCWLCQQECNLDHYNIEGTPCFGKQFDDIDPDVIALQTILNSSSAYLFFIGFFHLTFFTANLLVVRSGKNNRGFVKKISTFIVLSLLYGYLWFIFSLSNMILIFPIMMGIRKVRSLNYKIANFLCIWTYLILYFMFFITGIFIATFWYISIVLFILIRLITV